MSEKQFTARDIAALVEGKLVGSPDSVFTGVAALKEATENQVSFLGNKRYAHQLPGSKAGLVLVSPDILEKEYAGHNVVVCGNVDFAFSKVIMLFAPPPMEYPRTVHPTAFVDPTAKLGQDVHVGPNAVIDAGAEIGDGAIICAGAYVGQDAEIGPLTQLYPNSTVLFRCKVGAKCIIHSGVVIGADGFGFFPTPKGIVKIPQVGTVEIGDDVEIGANSTVDRARFGKTVIMSNVKIDDQVMVAHNVVIHESSILVGQCGIAGSAEIGRGVIVAAKAGVAGHLHVGDGAKIAGTSGVHRDVPVGAVVAGTPAESQRELMARLTLPPRFERLKAKVEELAKKVAELSR